ncbi:MAG: hypothetical protein GX924_01550, partial [Clostridiaceae bacterium]|nr:hypothetical protein [Clostridiaceae bacterium]
MYRTTEQKAMTSIEEGRMESFETHSHNGLMVVISGPSGAGKNSIISSLLEADANRVHSISLTTREPRP